MKYFNGNSFLWERVRFTTAFELFQHITRDVIIRTSKKTLLLFFKFRVALELFALDINSEIKRWIKTNVESIALKKGGEKKEIKNCQKDKRLKWRTTPIAREDHVPGAIWSWNCSVATFESSFYVALDTILISLPPQKKAKGHGVD